MQGQEILQRFQILIWENKKDALKEVTVDGAVYGIPYNAWYQGVIYNKDIFQKYKLTPPTTREGLEEVVACLERKGIVPFASHFQESWEVANMTMQYMMNEIFDKMPDWGDQFRKGTKIMRATQRYRTVLKIISLF